MPKSDATMIERNHGRLVLHSIPSKETEAMVVSYLSRMVKNVPAAKLAQKVKRTPFVLSKNIAVDKGEKIAQNLRDLGAKAEFVLHDSGARGREPLPGAALASDFESLHVVSDVKKSPSSRPAVTADSGKRLITAIVVIILIAVIAMLSWQLYHLVTEKLFN